MADKDRTKELEKKVASLEQALITRDLGLALDAAGGSRKLLAGVVRPMLALDEHSGQYRTRVMQEDGKTPRYSATGEMTLAGLMAELKVDENFAAAFEQKSQQQPEDGAIPVLLPNANTMVLERSPDKSLTMAQIQDGNVPGGFDHKQVWRKAKITRRAFENLTDVQKQAVIKAGASIVDGDESATTIRVAGKNKMTRAEFDELPHHARHDFMADGGILV